MNLYRISQNQNDGWDTYDSAIVCAANEDGARAINPSGDWSDDYRMDSWCSAPEHVKVEFIGIAADDIEPGIVLASFWHRSGIVQCWVTPTTDRRK